MNKAGSRIYIYIFTLLFIGEDSSALSEMSSVFEVQKYVTYVAAIM